MSIIKLNHALCTGCGACVNACALGAICMEADAEGFFYPQVSKSCVECDVCERTCPQLNAAHQQEKRKPEHGWLAVGTDKELIDSSASGGAFATFAKYVIEQKKGVAFGACMDNDFYVRHHCAQTLQELKPLLGSKYVQSDTGFTYKECKEVLDQGRYVLYSGTPCQIAGLKCYLGKAYDTLITVDIVCHGVSSPLAFQNYLRWRSKTRAMKVVSYRFRNRTKYDRAGFISKTVFQSDKQKANTLWQRAERDVYFKVYLDGKLFRTSCYSCPYAKETRVSDITIGDCNSYKKYKDFHPYEASSIVLLNSMVGEQFWNAVSNQFDAIPLDLTAEVQANGQLHSPSLRTEDRDAVCADFAQGRFEIYEESLLKQMTIQKRLRIWSQIHIPLKLRMKLSGSIRWLKRKVYHG